MKPRIDIDIRDYEGKTAELRDLSTFEPYEVYVNDERVCTSERVEELEDENAKLRELAKAAWGCVKRQVSCDECRMVFCGCTLQSVMCELGIEEGE